MEIRNDVLPDQRYKVHDDCPALTGFFIKQRFLFDRSVFPSAHDSVEEILHPAKRSVCSLLFIYLTH